MIYLNFIHTFLINYEEQNKGVKVGEKNVYFKFMTLITLNEANMNYSKHRLKEIFAAEEKRWKC